MSNFTDLETIGCDSHHKKEIDLLARHLRVPPHVEGGTRVCGNCSNSGDYMGCRGVVCVIFPANHDPQVLTRLVDVPRRRNHLR
jgi:hypothetical protein